MSELINNLVDKTAVMIPGVYTVEYESGKKGVEFNEEALNKFVELIVQHIVNRLEDERAYYANPAPYEPEDYYIKMAGKKDGIDDAIAMIRSDFGVKE